MRVRGGELEVTDLGSRNGTIVDGGQLTPNVASKIRVTSVVRIGGAVLVFEPAAPRPKGALAGLIEIAWKASTSSGLTTTAESAPPARLQQVGPRIVGPRGLIATHEAGTSLFIPETDAERFEASAALVRRICEEQKLPVEIRAASSAEARTIAALLANGAPPTTALVPPIIFKDGRYSVDALLSKLDGSDAPVLIVGETGVGKDVLARTLHSRSRRAKRPFVALNCAAFTEALFESELFGHERGAFTGATQAKTGLIESAVGGTVFLDEIGEMPLGMQAKLLRVVENREILRVGALVPKAVDVRFVFATNRDLRRD
ncbi:MAG TPA: sigma-54-dependent Fis family transcriptional regulator [Labilithrix sp.]|nr:sigma-54-dependent Fis family transcriptional regulator [Labilithrix sp.]